MKTFAECLYYLIREMGGLGVKAKDCYFDDALKYIRKKGFSNIPLSRLEIRALIEAARRRGRMDELDALVSLKEEDLNA